MSQTYIEVTNNFHDEICDFLVGDLALVDAGVFPVNARLVIIGGKVELFSNQPQIDGVVVGRFRNA